MTDAEWAEENPAPSKKLVPTWLWFCGGGCLVAVIIGVIAVMWGMNQIKEYTDADIQYPRLEESIAFDERPEDWEFLFAIPVPMHMWIFQDTRGYAVIIMDIQANQVEEVREQVFNPEFDGSFAGMGGRQDMTLSTIDVQGREIEMMTYYQESGQGQQANQSGQAATIDITPVDSDGMLLMMLIRATEGDVITAEDANEVLAPFHIGPNR